MTTAPISVERLRELLDRATPGPWEIHDCVSDGGPYLNMAGPTFAGICGNDPWGGNEVPSDADMRLIAAAINALPELLAVYEAVQEAPEVEVYAGHDGYAEIMLEPYIEAKAKLVGKRVALVEIVGGEE